MHPIIKYAVHVIFTLSSRDKVLRQSRELGDAYQRLYDSLSVEQRNQGLRVPSMPGVDEDMRGWSLAELLEHNVIVNRTISASVRQLAHGEAPHGAAVIDPKRDVMPSASMAGEEMQQLLASIDAHVELVSALGRLRGGARSEHPVFGSFDAHKWHCMFAFHLSLHLTQAKWVVRELLSREA
ncbi:DinB family protein [Rubritalea marina]|uniref:DinB family protein n=1 Tax=Rubritalea marina TaxID=361055 RepID=UPI00036EF5CE|nr:DinB family protein [Rubritalea marina]